MLNSCNEQVIYQKYKEISSASWDYQYRIPFSFTIKDTASNYNTYFNIRLKSTYLYSNIWILLKKFNSSGALVAEKKIEFKLADIDGRWYGQGLGDIIDFHILMEENIKFLQAGNYTYYFNHEMRNDELDAVIDIGLTVRKTEN
ncbi:gliding motility lipoprotein GldH [Bacteroidota bacterium]